MFAQVTSLRYWKSECTDLSGCEDALRADLRRGLFCVADGVGTTLFSNIWADILVQQFIDAPLMSSDPFEMEWWIRQAQKCYREKVPSSDSLGWNIRQKALEQGAYATLATLRFTNSEPHSATAQLLVIGDSCVILGRRGHIISFPLSHEQDFSRAPYCIPALLKNLNRYMLYAKTGELTLTPGDCLILATDAVARWIISGKGTGNPQRAWEAFLEVASKTASDWPAFIQACRNAQTMVDDDSTAIVITLHTTGNDPRRLGAQAEPSTEITVCRIDDFQQACSEKNKELIAITYGDGILLSRAGYSLTDEEKNRARIVADALRNMLQAMRNAMNMPNFVDHVEPIWRLYADVLIDEPCAETIRKSLVARGVQLI